MSGWLRLRLGQAFVLTTVTPPAGSMKITIHQSAEEVRASTASVSRILNSNVKSEQWRVARELVQQKATRLGYRGNAAARWLRQSFT